MSAARAVRLGDWVVVCWPCGACGACRSSAWPRPPRARRWRGVARPAGAASTTGWGSITAAARARSATWACGSSAAWWWRPPPIACTASGATSRTCRGSCRTSTASRCSTTCARAGARWGRAGIPIVWEAEIINDQPPQLLAWRTLPGGPVAHAGSVRFTPAGASTRIDVSLQYDPPGGTVAPHGGGADGRRRGRAHRARPARVQARAGERPAGGLAVAAARPVRGTPRLLLRRGVPGGGGPRSRPGAPGLIESRAALDPTPEVLWIPIACRVRLCPSRYDIRLEPDLTTLTFTRRGDDRRST